MFKLDLNEEDTKLAVIVVGETSVPASDREKAIVLLDRLEDSEPLEAEHMQLLYGIIQAARAQQGLKIRIDRGLSRLKRAVDDAYAAGESEKSQVEAAWGEAE